MNVNDCEKFGISILGEHVGESLIFWCQNCDCRKVDSLNKDTGTFFETGGHKIHSHYKDNSGPYLTHDEWHSRIVWAVCSECLK